MKMICGALLTLLSVVSLSSVPYAFETPWEDPFIESYTLYDSPEPMSSSPSSQLTANLEHYELPEVYYDSDRSTYRLKMGDVLIVAVYGEKLTDQRVMVDPTGCISYLFLPAIRASGKTLKELRGILQEKLEAYYRFPLISITPIKFAGEFYTILGEVNKPGKRLIEGHTTVLSAIGAAEGFTLRDFRDQFAEQADLHHSFLARNGEYVPVDFEKLIWQGDLSQNVPLQEGDYIYIETEQLNQVYVLGFVNLPVTVDFVTTISLSEALAEAGGLLYESSSRVAVIRGSLACPTTYLIDVQRLLEGKACDFLLEPGDIIYVPPAQFTNLRLLAERGIAAFVRSVTSIAGTETFVHMHTHAAEDPFLGPVNTTSGAIFIP